jgi:two-component system response regulator RegA
MALSVLLVDDDPTFLALASRVLQEMGAEVATAPDASAAIEAANEMKPDAALVDVWLPDRGGIDLGYEIAALPVVSSIPRDGRTTLPFVPKEELAGSRLRSLLTP